MDSARLQELYIRRSREIELKMGELRSALHQANEKCKELESVVGESRSLFSDSGLRGKEPEEKSSAQADLRIASTECAKCSAPEKKVEEPRSVPSDVGLRKEGPLEELTAQDTAAGRECASVSAAGTSKRHSDNAEEEPPRKMRHASREEDDVNVTDKLGWSPLHYAANDGDVQGVRALLNGGADARLRDRKGMTPLHYALWREKEAAELLAILDDGNDIQDFLGRTPLHHAAARGHVMVVRLLLAGGARTRVQEARGRTPLHLALEGRKEAAAELLVEADGGIEIRDARGTRPLHRAAERRFAGIVEKLLRNDVDPHPRDDAGNYPLQLALQEGGCDGVPKKILSRCALKDISLDWTELKLAPDDLRFCVEEVSRCSEEIRLMKETTVGASSLSYHDVVTRHVRAVASRLPSEGVRGAVLRRTFERDFPHYAHLISLRLRSAVTRRAWTHRCLRCFSRLPPVLPPLPAKYTGVVLSCLRDGDMENFVRAVEFLPWE